MIEKFGVELEAKIDKFKANMDKAKEMMKNFGKNVKTDFQVGADISKAQSKIKQLENSIERYEKIISGLNKKGIYEGPEIDGFNKKIEVAENNIEKLETAMGKVKQTPFVALSTTFQNAKNTFIDLGKRIKESFSGEAKQNSEDVKNNIEGIGKATRGAGNGLSSMFGQGIKSLKRFALSLFGIQSIWRVLSRASSTYMQQNTELANKMQGIWNGLATLIGPVVEVLADVFMKLIGYINVVTKALFNFDFVAKANANTLKKYQQQANKTSKALAGIDELQNLNQQTSEDEGPKGLIEIPELNQGVVKFLEDVSKALKDNWDWLQYVLIGFGAVFGASAVAGWLGNIGKLLGIGGIGGTGLLGLFGVLTAIAGIGTIVLTIKVIEAYNVDKNEIAIMEDLNNSFEDITDNLIEMGKKGYKKGTREQKDYIELLKDGISTNAQLIKDNQDTLTSYGLIEGALAQNSGKYQEMEQNIEKAENRIDKLIEAFKKQYEQGNLTAEQEEYYLELLNTRNETIKKSGAVYSTITKNYEGLTESNIRETVKWKDKTEDLGLAIKNTADTLVNATDKNYKVKLDDSKVQNEPSVVQSMKKGIEEVLKNPFLIKFDTSINGPSQQNLNSLVSGLTGGANAIANALGLNGNIVTAMKNPINQAIDNINAVFSKMGLPKISKLAIGTDLVKSDGLAYIHKGEQVVPADVVKGGYSGTNGEEINVLLRTLIEVVQEKEFSATISPDDVGKASVNYIKNQSRIRGESVI